MKPIIFNQGNCKKYAPGKGTVTVAQKGRISFNKRSIEILDLKKDSNINFIQDEDNLEDWYIEKTTSKDGFIVNENPSGRFINSAGLATKILRSVDVGTSCKFILSPKVVHSKYYAIITHSKV